MKKMRLIDCHTLTFSPQLFQDRMDRALGLFGMGVIQRILCFALYLLGASRTAIGQSLNVPTETVKSTIRALKRDGLGALEDRRQRLSTFLPRSSRQPPPITLKQEQEHIVVDLGVGDRHLKLCSHDPLQLRTVLLSMLNSGLLSKGQVAQAIGLAQAHIATLAHRLDHDGALSLVDQREGQKQDYRVTPAVKAELIQQFTVDVITEGRTTSSAIAAKLTDRCQITVPARTVRHHLVQMGLTRIKHSLPQLVAAVKKTSKDSV